LGVSDVDYLLSCGNVRLAAGDRDGAATFYRRALDHMGAVIDARCPRRLRHAYVSQKNISEYVTILEGLPAGPAGTPDARAYKARFGLK
jgi:hypothetical protein